MIGRVYRIERDRGYAFARAEDQQSRFLHARDFVYRNAFDNLPDNAIVDFESIRDDQNRLQGKNIRVLDSDMTVADYARTILPEGWALLWDLAVPLGQIIVDHKTANYKLHPGCEQWTIGDNAKDGIFLPSNRS